MSSPFSRSRLGASVGAAVRHDEPPDPLLAGRQGGQLHASDAALRACPRHSPRAAAACDALARLQDPFAPTPKDVACIQLYGGPQVARVSGMLMQAGSATFRRRDGCEIVCWARVGALPPTAPRGLILRCACSARASGRCGRPCRARPAFRSRPHATSEPPPPGRPRRGSPVAASALTAVPYMSISETSSCWSRSAVTRPCPGTPRYPGDEHFQTTAIGIVATDS